MKIHTETGRLILREFIPEDAAGIFELDTDPDVHAYLGNNPLTKIEQAEQVVAFIRKQYEENGIGRWAVIEKESGRFAGWAGLKWVTEPVNNRSEYYDLGFRFIKKYWGKGYATEAARASLAYGFDKLNLEEIFAIVDVRNEASIRVLEKAGMIKVEEFELEGDPHFFYRITRKQ
jgi:ribosomal-protein-alanine N-acetyltransferase